jgi:aspartyl-tRNA(Asn)/glutamyl-tRNA(Gln) amidotransferase subunit A
LSVVEQCLQRIDAYESQVRAWVLVDRAGAIEQARQMDAELRTGRWRGPLHGVPIGIKDIVDVVGFPTSAGSPLLKDNVATRDATIVVRLREAGAVILGKTVTTQFASFDPPPTRNPWNLERTPGGSSSGSAAAVACGMCLGAIGSQTGGSITRPAAYCGVAGCKPTYGRVSTAGVLPLAPSMDHPGPIARTVMDLAILLDAIAGPDPRDPLCATERYMPIAKALGSTSPRLLRIGLLRELFWERAEPASREMIELTVSKLSAAGIDVRETALPAQFAGVLVSHRIIMSVEAAADHEDRFKRHRDAYLPKIRGLVEEGLGAAAPAYVRAKRHQQSLTRAMVDCFRDSDVLLTPAALGPAPDTSTTGDPAFNSPWSFTGFPTVSIPVQPSPNGLPMSIQLVGQSFRDTELFSVASVVQLALESF